MFDAGANQYTFHIEATETPLELCRKIREVGMKVSVTESTKELFLNITISFC